MTKISTFATKTGHRTEDLKVDEATIAFAQNLFAPQENDFGKKNFNCTLLWPKGQVPKVAEEMVLAVAQAHWGDKAIEMLKNEVIKNPFLDGDGKQGRSKKTGEPHPGFPGTKFIRCSSGEEYKPKVFDRKRNPIFEKDGCRSGSTVMPVINAYSWDSPKQGPGVSFGISLVQVVKNAEGDEILGGSGGPDPDKFLEVIEDDGDAPAETKSGEGAAGLFG